MMKWNSVYEGLIKNRNKSSMRTITKRFTSIKKAEQYQDWLYDKYDYVCLNQSPLLSESGTYVWEVEEEGVLIRKSEHDKTL